MPAIFEICRVVVASNPFSRNNLSAAIRIRSFVRSLLVSRFPATFLRCLVDARFDFIKYEHAHNPFI